MDKGLKESGGEEKATEVGFVAQNALQGPVEADECSFFHHVGDICRKYTHYSLNMEENNRDFFLFVCFSILYYEIATAFRAASHCFSDSRANYFRRYAC